VRPRGANQTPGQYSAKTKSALARELRRSIDAADRNGSTDVPPEAALMVASDAQLSDRHEAMVEALAQIPPFVVGRTKYRVIGERVIDAGTAQERRRVALLCRTQSSELHEHAAACLCTTCGWLAHELYPAQPRAWYHDASRTWHVRNADGTFTQIEGPTHVWRPSRLP
jgi:hypothetical protein